MTASLALALALELGLGLAAPDALAPAEEAFARAEYARAEALALAQARPPREGAARYLAGLAAFRAGRPADALTALDAAARADDPPARPLWRFNRAACLSALGRFSEAEADFLGAADDPALAGAALAEAGFAALDAGAPERARALLPRARAAARGAALGLVEDLEKALRSPAPAAAARDEAPEARREAAREHEAGLAAFDQGDFAAARARFARAAALDPGAGPSRVMEGAAALRQGDRPGARAALAAALGLPLDPADASAARAYLDAASPGLAARGLGWEASAQAGLGYDDNVLQSGLGSAQERAPIGGGRVRSPLASAGGGVAWRGRLLPALVLEAAYGLDQLAYGAAAARDYALQQHALSLTGELAVGERLRLGLSGSGQAAFTGWSDFRGLQVAGGAGAFAALDGAGGSTTRLDLEWDGKRGRGAEFAHLTGQRLELALSHALPLGPATLSASARLRSERIGTLVQEGVQMPIPLRDCPLGCLAQSYVIPYGYDGLALAVSLQAPLGSRLTLGLSGGWEGRRGRGESVLLVARGDGTTAALDRKQRLDDRFTGALLARLRLGGGFSLDGRYDLLVNRSNVARVPPGPGACPPGGACHLLDYDDKNFVKQVAGLELRKAF